MKQPIIKCRNCQNLDTFRDPKGLLCRCRLGFFDTKNDSGPDIRAYLSVLSLKSGGVLIWKAQANCNSHTVAKDET